jgi:hypothetical protein
LIIIGIDVLFFGESLDLLNFLLDGGQNQGEKGVIGVLHLALSKTDQGAIENLLVDLFPGFF